MNQLNRTHILCASILGVLMVGCSSSDSNMTDKEADALKHPPKGAGMPPEAAAAMAKGAEQMKIQNAGVDSRGVPIAQSKLGNAPVGPGGPGLPTPGK